jgi:hypothetical protein
MNRSVTYNESKCEIKSFELRGNSTPCSEQLLLVSAKSLENPQKMPFSHSILRFQNVLKIEKIAAYLDFLSGSAGDNPFFIL